MGGGGLFMQISKVEKVDFFPQYFFFLILYFAAAAVQSLSVARQAPLSIGFPRQEYWSGLPFSSPWDLPNPGTEPNSPALAGGFFTTESPRKPILYFVCLQIQIHYSSTVWYFIKIGKQGKILLSSVQFEILSFVEVYIK